MLARDKRAAERWCVCVEKWKTSVDFGAQFGSALSGILRRACAGRAERQRRQRGPSGEQTK